MNELGLVYKQQQMYKEAIEYLNKSLKICLINGFISTSRYIYLNLSTIYEKINDINLAFSYYKKFIQVKDEVINEQKYKKINELETRYQTKQKEDEINILNQKDQLSKTKIKQARLVIVFVSFGIIVVIVFLVLIFKQYQDKRKANVALEEKNKLITKQKQDITDSIMYASKIQSAVLPPDEIFKGYFKDYFILYLPKDIVSGDFYWITEYEGKIIFAAADCTGHGVPGAFMSMLGTAFLNEIVSKYKGLHPSDILNELRLNIIKSLHQKDDTQERKDGMDISLTMVNFQNYSAEYAGAYNPLIICRNKDLIEYKADRQPVGIYKKTMEPFTNHVIQLQPNDSLYSFSDGYVDQFGSDNKKKFMIKNLKELLLKIQKHDMNTQRRLLYDNYITWKGEVEQIDDVLLFGIKI